MKLKADGQLQIQCQRSYSMVSVMELLGDAIDINRSSEQEGHANINVQAEYIEGDKKVTEKNIHIEGATIHGSVVAAEII